MLSNLSPPHSLLKGSLKPLSFLLCVLALSLSLSYLVSAWTEPSVNPPNPDPSVSTPINIGPTGQSKSGGLSLNTGGAPNGLIVELGNVGIGTTGPGYKLEVVNSVADAAAITVRAGTLGGTVRQYFRDNSGVKLFEIDADFTNNRMLFQADDVTAMTILRTSGNVGVGTASPGQKLTVAGTIESTSGGIKFPDGTTQTTAAAGGIPASAIWIQQNSQSSPGCDRPSRQWDPTACGYTVGSNGGYVGTYSAGGGCHRGPRLLVNGAVVSTGEYRVRIPLSAGSTVSVQSECDQGGCSSSSPLQCTLGLWDY